MVKKNLPIKALFRLITEELKANLEIEGLEYMVKSSKLVLSEQNHQIYMCNDPEVIEKIYQ